MRLEITFDDIDLKVLQEVKTVCKMHKHCDLCSLMNDEGICPLNGFPSDWLIDKLKFKE